ncbi:MAG: helix-turn-helix domain-containing protein [Ancalomicrobiaceae bacterium]|nr:helix-turn-helix domain-containing protein [Ancalomicrobiaceae bacterium]
MQAPLRELSGRIPPFWPTTPLDDWTDQLRSICGHFNPSPVESRTVTGTATISDAAGLEVAQVANDLGTIHRDFEDIRRDYGENLFLLLQLEGSCGIEQRGRQATISPGDCILVDASSPSVFHFGGQFSNHLSVHLPRQLILSDRHARIEISRRLAADDPMSSMLRALVAKLLQTRVHDSRATHLCELLYSATRQAFAHDGELERFVPVDAMAGRLEIVQILIDRHLTEERLTPQWLADKVGISLRTLQDDMSSLGTTATSLIRMRRLHLVREQLQQFRRSANATTIAEVAYSAGFSDISYFNRCFRKMFDCSPKDMLRQSAVLPHAAM